MVIVMVVVVLGIVGLGQITHCCHQVVLELQHLIIDITVVLGK